MIWYFAFAGTSFLVYICTFFVRAVRPPRILTPVLPSHFGLAHEKISISSLDGTVLQAWLIADTRYPKKPVVVVCHGYGADKGDLLGLVRFLAEDYTLMLFDFRAHGESGGKYCTFGIQEVWDLEAVIQWLKEKDLGPIGILGLSMGASIALTRTVHPVKAIVADSGYATLEGLIPFMFRGLGPLKILLLLMIRWLAKSVLGMHTRAIEPQKLIHKSRIPLLIIHGGLDQQTPVEHAHLLKRARPDAVLWIVSDADHAENYWKAPAAYKDKVLHFFQCHLSNQ